MRILLASGTRLVSDRWKDLLAGQHLVETASSLDELRTFSRDSTFDLLIIHRLLVDQVLFGEIRTLAPAAKFFLLSDQPDEEEGIAFLKRGIVGYGNTYISQERLAAALQVIKAGGVWLGQKVIQQLILETRVKASTDAGNSEKLLSVLTPKERNVAERVARGLTNLEIAAELDIAERTVKAHLTDIYERMRVPNRLSLALLINRGSIR